MNQDIAKKISQLKQSLNCTSSGFKTAQTRDLDDHQRMYNRYLTDYEKNKIFWDKIKLPNDDDIVDFSKVISSTSTDNIRDKLSKLAILKLNGGLGTTMGCTGPKSIIDVRSGKNFLDIVVQQLQNLNNKYKVDIPLILMNSFNTSEPMESILAEKKADGSLKGVNVMMFNQRKFPRIHKFSHIPTAETADPASENYTKDSWYPPGHGDVYTSLVNSQVFGELKKKYIEYIFMANIDNLGAVVEEHILDYLFNNKIEFCMEVTQKTRADIKGGTIIRYENDLRLLEIAQCPKENVPEFKSITKFKVFNTNNLWFSLSAVEKNIKSLSQLDIIENNKVDKKGNKVIQLECACGSGMRFFSKSCGILVPRTRFLPVKTCDDLFLIRSDFYALDNGRLVVNPKRYSLFGNRIAPTVKLGRYFSKFTKFMARMPSLPSILELSSLTVSGDVYFGKGVVLKGMVVIVPQEDKRIDIADGSVLNNKVVAGGLTIVNI
mgnify:CR=1 FL=1